MKGVGDRPLKPSIFLVLFKIMKKAKSLNQPKTTYPIEEEPIVLSKPLLDIFLAEPNPANLIGLYCFYYYTAKWQGTNQPKATIIYTAKGMKWGQDKLNNLGSLFGMSAPGDVG